MKKKFATVQDAVIYLAESQKLSPYDLEKQSGISHQTFYKYLRKEQPLKTLNCRVLKFLLARLGEDSFTQTLLSHVKRNA